MRTHYEVETLLGNSFENCWTNADGDTPVTFDSLAEAQKELAQMLDDVKEAVKAGDMSQEYDLADYRIVKVTGDNREVVLCQ